MQLIELFAGADGMVQALHTNPGYQPDAETQTMAKQTSSTLAFELARHIVKLATREPTP